MRRFLFGLPANETRLLLFRIFGSMKARNIEIERAKALEVIKNITDAETLHEIAVLYGNLLPTKKRTTIEEYNKDLEEAEKEIVEGKVAAHEDVVKYFAKWQDENLKK